MKKNPVIEQLKKLTTLQVIENVLGVMKEEHLPYIGDFLNDDEKAIKQLYHWSDIISLLAKSREDLGIELEQYLKKEINLFSDTDLGNYAQSLEDLELVVYNEINRIFNNFPKHLRQCEVGEEENILDRVSSSNFTKNVTNKAALTAINIAEDQITRLNPYLSVLNAVKEHANIIVQAIADYKQNEALFR